MSTASSAPNSIAFSGTASMSGSSYWPRSAVKAYGIAPRSRIQASAQHVSRPPEKAIPTFSPTGSDERMTPLPFLFIVLEVVRERIAELVGAGAVADGDEDRVVARDRAGDLREVRVVDRVGERDRETACRVDHELVEAPQVGRAGQRIDQPAVAVSHLDEPEPRDVARHRGLHGVDALVAERLRELGLGGDVTLAHEPENRALALQLRRQCNVPRSRSMPMSASSSVIVRGGVRRSAVSPAVPTSRLCSSAACATGPAGRPSSTASNRPAPRTPGSCASNRSPTARTWESRSSSTASTTAQAAAHETGLPPKVEAWSPGT